MAGLAVRWRYGNSTGADSTATTSSRWTNTIGGASRLLRRAGCCARGAGEDLADWLEYCAEGVRQTLENVWLRVQVYQVKSPEKLVLRSKQQHLLNLLRDHGSMAPSEIWEALAISRQGAMDLLRPLPEAGLVEKVGGKKTGRFSLKQS